MESARAAGLNVSRLTAAAVADELDGRARTAALDAYLAQLDTELEPVPDDELQRAADWPPQVPAVVLAEALTGDVRRDFHANHLLRTCQIRDVGEPTSREAARLRTATGTASTISAVDAVVAAFACLHPDPIVLTSDVPDLGALAAHTVRPITVAAT